MTDQQVEAQIPLRPGDDKNFDQVLLHKIEVIAHSHGALLMVDIGQQHDVPCAGTTLGAWSRHCNSLSYLVRFWAQ